MNEPTKEYHLLFQTDTDGNVISLLLATTSHAELERFRKRPDLSGIPHRGVTITNAIMQVNLLDMAQELDRSTDDQLELFAMQGGTARMIDMAKSIKGFDFYDPIVRQTVGQ